MRIMRAKEAEKAKAKRENLQAARDALKMGTGTLSTLHSYMFHVFCFTSIKVIIFNTDILTHGTFSLTHYSLTHSFTHPFSKCLTASLTHCLTDSLNHSITHWLNLFFLSIPRVTFGSVVTPSTDNVLQAFMGQRQQQVFINTAIIVMEFSFSMKSIFLSCAGSKYVY